MAGWNCVDRDLQIWEGTLEARVKLVAPTITIAGVPIEEGYLKKDGSNADTTIDIQGENLVVGNSLKVGDGLGLPKITFDALFTDATVIWDGIKIDFSHLIGAPSSLITNMNGVTLTVTGTVQGEQITSTDDINATNDITAGGTVQAEHLYSTDDAQIDDTLTINHDLIINHTSTTDTDTVIQTNLGGGKLFMTRTGATPALECRRANGTTGSPTDLDDDNVIYSFRGRGYNEGTSAFSAPIAQMDYRADGAHASNSLPTKIVWSTTKSGAVGVTRYMTLDKDGNLELPKIKMTSIGGYAILLTNKTGANSVAGEVVIASTGTADAVAQAGANSVSAIGIFLEDGIADGSEAWIVVSGIAYVKMDAGGAALGDRIITSATAGRGLVSNAPAVAVHFQEIGHCIETTAANALGRCVLHFL